MNAKKTSEDKQKKTLEEKVLKTELIKKEEDVVEQEKQKQLVLKIKKEQDLKLEIERQVCYIILYMNLFQVLYCLLFVIKVLSPNILFIISFCLYHILTITFI